MYYHLRSLDCSILEKKNKFALIIQLLGSYSPTLRKMDALLVSCWLSAGVQA